MRLSSLQLLHKLTKTQVNHACYGQINEPTPQNIFQNSHRRLGLEVLCHENWSDPDKHYEGDMQGKSHGTTKQPQA